MSYAHDPSSDNDRGYKGFGKSACPGLEFVNWELFTTQIVV
jgi:hypothetical protein